MSRPILTVLASAVVAAADAAPPQQVVGTVRSQLGSTVTIVTSETLTLLPDATVTVDGASATAAALKPDMDITLEVGPGGVVKAVATSPRKVAGRIHDHSGLALGLWKGQAVQTYHLTDATAIKVDGKPGKEAQIHPDMSASLTLSGGVVVELDATSPHTASGRIASRGGSDIAVGTTHYTIPDGAPVTLDGHAAGVDQLAPEMEVRVVYDDYGVISVDATSPKAKPAGKGKGKNKK